MGYKYVSFGVTFLYLAKTKYKKINKDCLWISFLPWQRKQLKKSRSFWKVEHKNYKVVFLSAIKTDA